MKKVISHTCGHTTSVSIDSATKSWVEHFAAQPCFVCEPTALVERLCGHTEQLPREFQPPRRLEMARLKECRNCSY